MACQLAIGIETDQNRLTCGQSIVMAGISPVKSRELALGGKKQPDNVTKEH